MESKVKLLMSDWDYDRAVALAKPIAQAWAKKTVEMARLLYVAREKLSNSGFRSDLMEYKQDETSSAIGRGQAGTSCKMAQGLGSDSSEFERNIIVLEHDIQRPCHTFEDFCNDIGIPKRTAYSWIECYDPDKDYLLSTQEYKEAKKLELDTFYEDITEMRETDPGYVPKDIDLKWSRKFKWSETQYQKWLTARNFSPSSKDIEPAFISRDAKIQEFGLWNTEFIIDLQQKCQDITHDKAERFADYVAAYKEATPSGITSRELMRIPVIVEAVLSPLPPEGRKKCLGMLSMFFAQDGWNNDDWLKEVR